jgi:polyisoprenoid-binding protein YceI
MRQVLGLFAVVVAGSVATAADAKFALTPENTTVGFVGTKPDGKHEGGFKKVTGSATVTDGDPTKLALDVLIDTDSLWSDDPKLTGHLKAPDFFDVKTNPTAKFVSTKVEKTADGYAITGDLTLNGKTKAVQFPAKISTAGGIMIDAGFLLDRTQFGMTYGKGKIDDNVAVTVKVAAK